MSRTRVLYTCQECGNQSPKWLGRCPDCGAWNSYVEGARPAPARAAPVHESRVRPGGPGGGRPERLADVSLVELERASTGLPEFDRVLGGGIVPGSLVLIGGDPGIGKCVVGSTRVLDPVTGDFVPISEWAQGLRPVLSFDERTGRLAPAKTAAFLDQGVRPVVAVTTRLGRTLRCTPTHPVMTPEGWRPVGELPSGTRIAAPRALPYFGQQTMPEHQLKLLAYVLSDGSASSAVCVTNALPEVVADLTDVASRFGLQLRVYPKARTAAMQLRFVRTLGDRAQARQFVAAALRRVRTASGVSWAAWGRAAAVDYGLFSQWRQGTCVPSEAELGRLASAAGVTPEELAAEARDRAEMRTPVARLLESVGLRFKTARDKAVPDCVFRLPKTQLALFLKVLFSCDGSVYVNGVGQPGVSYSTISRRLAGDVQHLLLRFGFTAKLRTKRSHVAGRPYEAYELQLLGTLEVQRFLREIGIWGREAAVERVASLLPPRTGSTQTDTVPTGPTFWSHLREVKQGATFRDVSRRAGVKLMNRRHNRPLRRSTVAALATSLGSQRLAALSSEEVYWDEIVSVVADGEARVYDLSVPQGQSFVANDLVVHNSTLLLEAAANVAATGRRVLYVSGEESARQVRLRAERLASGTRPDGTGAAGPAAPGAVALPESLYVLAETNLDAVLAQVESLDPQLLIVDSVQTVYLEGLPSSPGNVTQLRECALRLMGVAKARDLPVFLVGHVTKEGNIAGPRSLEHIVDAVLYLEGERFYAYRLLRAEKNRFGSTNEIGVFEMEADGLRQVPNPSAAFLGERQTASAGSAVTVPLEGTRALLVEVQALVAPSGMALPRRTSLGVDLNRLHLLLAVLGKRVGIPLASQDVYVNVVAGLKIAEPAADLGLALAIASSWQDVPVDAGLAVVGEVGLLGELRPVRQMERRLAEASRLGFERCIVPAGDVRRLTAGAEGGREVRREGLLIQGASTVAEALTMALGPLTRRRRGTPAERGERDEDEREDGSVAYP